MAASISASSGQGALFELVARGNKDNYFVKDSKDSTFPYDASYNSSAASLAERRTFVPLNAVTWGKSFEVEIDPYGDIMTECAFEIDLPTWLPPLPMPAINTTQVYNPSIVNGIYPITSVNGGRSYGYVNYIGYFLFENIQVYQDQFLIQEWSGDGLLAKQVSEGSYTSSFLQQTLGGLNSPSNSVVRGIQLRATPGHLRVKLPLPGLQCPGDGGFPLVAIPWQKFRIKAKLRNLEDLVVCSDTTLSKNDLAFYPWNAGQFRYDDGTGGGGNLKTFEPLTGGRIGQPTILLSTIQHYLPPELQEEIRGSTIQIPFRRQFENNFTFGELDYISLDKGGVAAVTRRLDGRHPTEKIFWFFRTQNNLDKNRLDDFNNDYFDTNVVTATQPYTLTAGAGYYNMKLTIAGRDRENLYEPIIWQNISQLVKDEKGSGLQIGEMKWTTGANFGVIYPASRQPEGTINFTTADRPTLYVELANIRKNNLLGQRRAEFRVFTEGWNVYEVSEGRGRLMFSS